jgi:hypothetical protein
MSYNSIMTTRSNMQIWLIEYYPNYHINIVECPTRFEAMLKD